MVTDTLSPDNGTSSGWAQRRSARSEQRFCNVLRHFYEPLTYTKALPELRAARYTPMIGKRRPVTLEIEYADEFSETETETLTE
jgi:hypothetical protein